MAVEAGVSLLIMTSDTFLIHARAYLEASVSPATVSQAKELRGSLEKEELYRREHIYVSRLNQLLDNYSNLDERGKLLNEHAKRLIAQLDTGTTGQGVSISEERTYELADILREIQQQIAQASFGRDSLADEIRSTERARQDLRARIESGED
jgi:hypothetical protein